MPLEKLKNDLQASLRHVRGCTSLRYIKSIGEKNFMLWPDVPPLEQDMRSIGSQILFSSVVIGTTFGLKTWNTGFLFSNMSHNKNF